MADIKKPWRRRDIILPCFLINPRKVWCEIFGGKCRPEKVSRVHMSYSLSREVRFRKRRMRISAFETGNMDNRCQYSPPTEIWHIRRHISLGLHRLKWPVSLPKFRIVTTLMMVIPSDTIRPRFPLTHWTSGYYFLSESTSYFHHSPRNCKIERSTSVPKHEKPEKSSFFTQQRDVPGEKSKNSTTGNSSKRTESIRKWTRTCKRLNKLGCAYAVNWQETKTSTNRYFNGQTHLRYVYCLKSNRVQTEHCRQWKQNTWNPQSSFLRSTCSMKCSHFPPIWKNTWWS